MKLNKHEVNGKHFLKRINNAVYKHWCTYASKYNIRDLQLGDFVLEKFLCLCKLGHHRLGFAGEVLLDVFDLLTMPLVKYFLFFPDH